MGQSVGVYRLFLIGVSLLVTLLLVATLEYTRFGAQVRAAVDNQRMARGLGINVDRVFAITFALGSGLAGLGGALAVEIVGLDHAFAFTYLVYVLIVVAVGGLGSIAGSFVAATLLGISDMAGKYYFPELGAFLIYFVMVTPADVAAARPVRETLGNDVFRGGRAATLSRSADPLAPASKLRSGSQRCFRSCSRPTICCWQARSPSPRCLRCRSISSSAMRASCR